MSSSTKTAVPIPPPRVRVLVVEDEALVALDLEERLTRLGYEVSCVVDNGGDALNHARVVKIDLVLMDIHLRGELDGIETAAALRQILDVPLVFLTAHADEATLHRAGLTEPFGYVLKPFDERELRAAVQMALYRYQAESRVRKMERWLDATLRSIGDGVIATDPEGRIAFINATAEALIGWPWGAAIGKHLSEVFVIVSQSGAEETFGLLHRAMMEESSIILGEGRSVRARNGRLVPVENSIAAIRDAEGAVTGCVVIFRDQTAHLALERERRELEEQRQETKRLESLGLLASGIAHDFNNLLMAVTCNTSLGRTMIPEDSPLMPCLRNIEDASNRAALLCSQMLAYAGKEQVTLREVELSAFARAATRLLEATIDKNATLVLDLAEGLPPSQADPSQLQQVIMNLVINGAEALEGRPGTVVVRTRRFQASHVFLSACRVGPELPAGDYLMLEVSDNGHGMTPEVLTRIFDPFFTTKFTGRGLGLAAISGIVRSHGGALAVQSAPGAGTTFQVLFPPMKSASIKVAASPPDLSWRATGRALLVDDDLSIRIAGGAVLRHLGFEVETAEDGAQGVEKATAAGADYRFILLDLTMPKLDGHEAFAAIRKKLPSLPVLLMSGYSDQQATRLFELGGPVAFIQKPFTLGNLVVKLRPLLALQGAAA